MQNARNYKPKKVIKNTILFKLFKERHNYLIKLKLPDQFLLAALTYSTRPSLEIKFLTKKLMFYLKNPRAS